MAAITFTFLANTASGQDTPKVGVTMGYPSSIGVIWQVTDGVALRPELTFTHNSGESTTTGGISISLPGGIATPSTTVTTNDSWQVMVGVSALFYLSKHDALRTYVSPRWAYARASGSSSSGIVELGTFGSTSSTHIVAGSFGAQYALAPRFSVFGEVGLSFSRGTTSPIAPNTVTFITNSGAVSRTFGARSGAGVILFF
jgi:hypothetical protein